MCLTQLSYSLMHQPLQFRHKLKHSVQTVLLPVTKCMLTLFLVCRINCSNGSHQKNKDRMQSTTQVSEPNGICTMTSAFIASIGWTLNTAGNSIEGQQAKKSHDGSCQTEQVSGCWGTNLVWSACAPSTTREWCH